MAINAIGFPILSPEQANPFFNALQQGIKTRFMTPTLQAGLDQQTLANELAKVNLQFAPQMNQADLAQKMAQTGLIGQQAKYFGPSSEAEIALRQSQVPLNEAEARIKQFQAQNPLLAQTGPAGQIGAIQYLNNMYNKQQSQTNAGQAYQNEVPGPQTSVNQTIGAQVSNQLQQGVKPNPSNIMDFLQQGLSSALYPQQTQIPIQAPMQQALAPQQVSGIPKNVIPGLNANQGNDYSNLIMNSLNSEYTKRMAEADFLRKRANAYGWDKATADQKNFAAGVANAYGADPVAVVNAMSQTGKDMGSTLRDMGYDVQPGQEPVYLPTTKNRTDLNARKGAQEELNTLSAHVVPALTPYSRRFGGYSPEQIGDSLLSKNVDEQAKFLAAVGLQNEMSAIRLRMSGVTNIGREALSDMTNNAYGHTNVYRGLVSPEAFDKSQQYIDGWLNEAVDAYNKKISNVKSPEQKGIVHIKTPDGKTWSVPADKAQEALRRVNGS